MPVQLVAARVAVRAAKDRRTWLILAIPVAVAMFVVVSTVAMMSMPTITPPASTTTTRPGGFTVAPTGTVADIPPISYAAFVLASQGSEKLAGCYVRWQMIGGVSGIESGYGTFQGRTPDPVTGDVRPPIFGPELAPGSGFAEIPNNDTGRRWGVLGAWARALGVTQFLPDSWAAYGLDGNGDGFADPQNMFDGALSTAHYLCAHGYVEGNGPGTVRALLAYNPSLIYVNQVSQRAQALDEASKTATPAPTQPARSLTTVGGITVDASIAYQVGQLLAAAHADGLDFGGYGWRDNQTQIDLRRSHCGASQYAIFEMPSGECSPPTALPGTSLHEQGLAIDFYLDGVTVYRGSRGDRWLLANAARFDLHNLPSEAWHYSVSGR